jgi:hypothetical protein
MVVLSFVAFLLAWAPAAASADAGCQAPPGTAAVDQYCDNLPAAGGTTDPTRRGVRRLASLLPKPLAEQLRHHGMLGDVLLALPAGEISNASASPPLRKAVRRAQFDPGLDALLPGPAAGARSIVRAAASSGNGLGGGLGWALVATMFSLAVLSLWGVLRRE